MSFSDILMRSCLFACVSGSLLLVLGSHASHAQVVSSPPLGFPFPSGVTETWNEACTGSADVNEQCNQIGSCVSGMVGTSLNCTANDFAITVMTNINITDACTSTTDFFKADLNVRFSKQSPARYDPHTWLYRSNDLNDGASDFNNENADSGAYCIRIPLEAGLNFIDDGDMMTVLGQTAATETGNHSPTPDCTDADVSGTAFMDQTINGVILPCRDITDANLGLTPDGIVDISACTSWDNNTDNPGSGQCDGPQYDGLNEPEAGTSSKCGCNEFDGDALQVTIPNMTITKSCVDANDGDTDVSPGGVANCTITLTNSGSGLLNGSINASDEGYRYVDTFPIDTMAGGAVSNVNITNNNTVSDDPIYQNAQNVTFDNSTGILTIYPDNIRANNGTDGVVTVTYDFTVHTTVPLNTETDLTDTVCSSYYDSDAGTSITSDTDCSNATITAHVTIGSFHAYRRRGDIVFHWTTATEIANLGFHLYVVLGQTRYPLNGQLIASQVMNSTQLTSYTARIPDPVGGASSKFYIENVDMKGTTQMHGPFHINRGYGTPSLDVMSEDVDWVSVRAESAGKKQQRQVQLSQKRQQRTRHRSGSVQSETTNERFAIKVGVYTAGVYRITYRDLAALGLNLQALDPAAIALQSGGVSIPYYISSGDTAPFGSDSYIEFIGKSARNLYSPENIYLLTFNSEDRGTRIRSAQGSPRGQAYSSFYMATQTLTRERVYSFVSPLADNPWHDTWLLAIDAPQTKRYRFHPEGLASTADVGVTIDATIVGGVDWPEDREDHHVQLSLNDELMAEKRFDGIRAIHMTAETSASFISEHDNSIAMTLPADNVQGIDAIYIDAIDIHYPRNYIAKNDSLSFRSNDANFKIAGFSEPTIAVYAENHSGTIRLRHIEVTSDNRGYSVAFRRAGQDSTYYTVTNQSVLSASLELIERNDITHTAADHLIIAHPDFIGLALEDYMAERQRW